MEDLFRFILSRPVQASDDADVIPIEPSDDLSTEIDRSNSAQGAREKKRTAARKWRERSDLKSVDDLRFAKPLGDLLDRLGEEAGSPELSDLQAIIADILGQDDDGDRSAQLRADRRSLGDLILTNALLGNDPHIRSSKAVDLLRAADIVRRVEDWDESLEKEGGLAAALAAIVLLPPGFAKVDPPRTAQAPSQDEGAKRRKELLDRRERLAAAYDSLIHLRPDQFQQPKTKRVAAPSVELGGAAGRPPARTSAAARAERAALVAEVVEPTESKAMEHSTQGVALMMKTDAVAALSGSERSLLKEQKLDPSKFGVPFVVDRLQAELVQLNSELFTLSGLSGTTMLKLGTSYVDASVFDLGPYAGGIASMAGVPTTHGSVAPAGIGDLLVVRQFLKRYEGRELAHIENILLGEYKDRVHRRSRTTEETFTVETEFKKEEERDQQTTERFELKSETSRIQKEDTSFKIGAALSGKYGPVVEFKLSTDFAMNTSKEESQKIASSYSKDVTARASSKIFERRQEGRILKTIEVFEETNTHGFDNKTGTGHVVGQYQWVDKVYEAQVYNYGKRLLFDLMVPEPAAFLLFATTSQPKAGADLKKPKPFTKTPVQVTEANYPQLVAEYEVIGVAPPPQPYITISKVVEGEGKNKGGTTKSVEVPIPGQFWAVSYEWQAHWNEWPGGSINLVIMPGSPDYILGTVTLAAKTNSIEAFEWSVAIHCQRTDRALLDWQIKTHDAILQAYQKQVRDYEEKLAAMEVQAAQKFQGRNPLENELLVRTEMKKNAISIFTAQHFEMFGAIVASSQGFPESDLAEAELEGKYIRFFEQAFEWEQMMYFFYPYYWGRKNNWLKRALLQDTDPVFGEFLKAGSARLTLAVRPGFENAVLNYLVTGQTWDGGDLPDVTDPLYVPIITEIRERDKAPGKEVAEGTPWDVRLPTTLVILRDEAALPKWEKDSTGEWVPA